MEIKLLSTEINIGDPCHCPTDYTSEWSKNVNAKFIMNSMRGRATLIYQGKKITDRGWYAKKFNPERFGWNFSAAADLIDIEPAILVFRHLYRNEGSMTFSFHFKPDERERTPLQLAREFVFAIELQS
jgi:hypothetical protein